jgi:tetratricopeptide (TPR) repeat protein
LTDLSASPDKLAERALVAYKAGDYAQAVQDFSTARELFLTADLQLRAAEMSNNLCVCLLQLDQAQSALDIVRDTPAIFQQEGNLLLKAEALGNRAMAKASLGQYPEAEADYVAAARLFQDIDHQEGLQYTMQALSKLQLQQGRPIEALDAMQSGLSAKAKPSLRDRLLSWLFKIPRRFIGR